MRHNGAVSESSSVVTWLKVKKNQRIVAAVFTVLALVAVGFAVIPGPESAVRPTLEAVPSFDGVVPPTTVSVAKSTPEPTSVPAEPTPNPEVIDPWEVVTVTADTETGILHVGNSEFRTIPLFDAPDGNPVAFSHSVLNPTYFHHELTLMVTDGRPGDEWVKVQLPVRPNNSEAWIKTDGFSFSTHTFHATVNLSDFQVTVYEGDELISETAAVIGREAAPTPIGTWFINDKIEGGGGAYGSWILSLSAFSETLETFNGGLPVIAIHGTNAPEMVGTAQSSGCVRVPNEIIEFLAEQLPLGTPVTIVA